VRGECGCGGGPAPVSPPSERPRIGWASYRRSLLTAIRQCVRQPQSWTYSTCMDVRAGHGFQTPMRVRTLDADDWSWSIQRGHSYP
jgi:hypothetical protein